MKVLSSLSADANMRDGLDMTPIIAAKFKEDVQWLEFSEPPRQRSKRTRGARQK
jgi:hypothetical protein